MYNVWARGKTLSKYEEEGLRGTTSEPILILLTVMGSSKEKILGIFVIMLREKDRQEL